MSRAASRRVSYRFGEARLTAHVEIWARPSAGRAGMAMGLISIGPGLDWLDLPVDEFQYAYTDGGEEYRAACRATWAAMSGERTQQVTLDLL